jgi:hypothetical protein
MKLLLKFILSIIITGSSFAQTSENGNVKNLITSNTELHVNIPGTRLFMIPPKGFKISETFVGFQKGDEQYIQIFDLNGGSFSSNSRNVNRKAYEDKGLKVLEYSEFKLNEYSVKYVHLEGINNIASHQFIFGDSTFSVMIIGSYYIGEKEISENIIASNNSTYYDKSFTYDPIEIAEFSINTSNSSFKFCQFASNTFSFNLTCEKSNNLLEPRILISQFPTIKEKTLDEYSTFFLNSLRENGFIYKNIESQENTIIHGIPGIQKIYNGYMNGEKVKIFIYSFFSKNYSICVLGIVHSDFEKYITEFKEISKTIKLK